MNSRTVPWSSAGSEPRAAAPAGTLAGTITLDPRVQKASARSFVIGAGLAVALGVGIAVFSFRGSGNAPSARPAATTPVEPTVARPSPASPPSALMADVGVSPAPSSSDVANAVVAN